MKMISPNHANRSSNVELLRVLAMFFIIAHHIGTRCGIELDGAVLSYQTIFVTIISFGGKLGVNLFILITGYYLSHSRFKMAKAIALIINTTIYSLALFALANLLIPNLETDITWFTSCFPIVYSIFWFISVYFILYIFSPILNRGISLLSRQQFRILIWLMVFVFSVIPTLFNSYAQCSEEVTFVLIYFIGAYLRRYPLKHDLAIWAIPLGLLVYIATIAMSLGLYQADASLFGVNEDLIQLSRQYSCFMLLSAVLLFIGFLNLKIPYSPLINSFGSATFGIYMIHDYRPLRLFYWFEIFRFESWINSRFLYINTLMAIITVFLVCGTIAIIYDHTINRLVVRFSQFITSKIPKIHFK